MSSQPIPTSLERKCAEEIEKLAQDIRRAVDLENGYEILYKYLATHNAPLYAVLAQSENALRQAKQALSWSVPSGGHTCAGVVSQHEATEWCDDANDAIDETLTKIVELRKENG